VRIAHAFLPGVVFYLSTHGNRPNTATFARRPYSIVGSARD
jgi:hypothetical protein